MEVIKANQVLKFNDNQLQNVRKALGYEDVNKLKQDIELLREWIQKQSHFRIKNFNTEYLERLLIYNKGSSERTKQKLDRLCTCTNLMPEFLQNFDIKNEFQHSLIVTNNCVLPKPTKDNYRVLISTATGENDEDFHLIQYYRYFMLIGHYMMHNDYCHGYEWIIDPRFTTKSIIFKLNPIIIQKGLTLIAEAMSQRIKNIHLISGSKFFDTILSLLKQGLSAKLRKRLIIHPNPESLYAYVLREDLPKDYGGDERSIKELNDELFKEISSDEHIEQVKFMERATTDETCRMAFQFNEEYSGMPGSFKTLCVD